jgi:transglutaminase superfamily protein/coenzyme PQQ synthesis protein D (PqqD)
VLLDVVGGRYHTLNEVGGRVWELLGDKVTVDTIAHAICVEYDISPGDQTDSVRRDTTALLARLAELGLVIQEHGPTSARSRGARPATVGPVGRRQVGQRGSLPARVVKPPAADVPSVAGCTLLLTLTKVLLRTVGFQATMRLIHDRTWQTALHTAVPEPVKLAATERAVATAAALYPGRALCLEQSVVLYYCLRRAGVAARFRLGYQPFPFAAHAWVECGGEPVNDVAEHVAWFTPLPDLDL